MPRHFVAFAFVAFIACGSSGEKQVGNLPIGVTCEECTADQVCLFTSDFDGELRDLGCADFPSECADDRSCECVNRPPGTLLPDDADRLCTDTDRDEGACQTIDGIALVNCLTTLG